MAGNVESFWDEFSCLSPSLYIFCTVLGVLGDLVVKGMYSGTLNVCNMCSIEK